MCAQVKVEHLYGMSSSFNDAAGRESVTFVTRRYYYYILVEIKDGIMKNHCKFYMIIYMY